MEFEKNCPVASTMKSDPNSNSQPLGAYSVLEESSDEVAAGLRALFEEIGT